METSAARAAPNVSTGNHGFRRNFGQTASRSEASSMSDRDITPPPAMIDRTFGEAVIDYFNQVWAVAAAEVQFIMIRWSL
jgi:hypothetical protein